MLSLVYIPENKNLLEKYFNWKINLFDAGNSNFIYMWAKGYLLQLLPVIFNEDAQKVISLVCPPFFPQLSFSLIIYILFACSDLEICSY